MSELIAVLPATFVPLFVATDVFGMLPVFVLMTEGMEHRTRTIVALEAAVTAFAAGALFAILGGGLSGALRIIGIGSGYLEISVGVILFVLAAMSVSGRKRRHNRHPMRVGIVPLGFPLIAGPAVLATVVFLTERYGPVPTLISLALNMMILLVAFYGADTVIRRFGERFLRVLSKVAAVLLILVAVAIIYLGFHKVFGPWM